MVVVTLLTDFGLGEYVAQLKGVLLAGCPTAVLVDIAHDLPPQAIESAAYVLWAVAPRFPGGTVHLAVVDPGVGTPRRGLVAACSRGTLVGPDNGLLVPAAEALGHARWFAIKDREPLARASRTFHGRDVFAPLAARLAQGLDPVAAGPRIADPIDLELFDARAVEARGRVALQGRVLHVDRFGNVVTNIGTPLIGALAAPAEHRAHAPLLAVRLGARSLRLPFLATYALARPRELLATIGSSALLEFAVREGSAARRMGARPGMRVRVMPHARARRI